MKLRRLSIERLPGIDESFVLDEIGDGIQVIVGPNGIGKSSLIRALRALLWSDRGAAGYVTASADFEGDDERWSVERDGTRHRWQRDGIDSDAPSLPAAHLDGCFFLVLRDLLDAAEDSGVDLARRVRRQMSGGFDLDKVETTLFEPLGRRYGSSEHRGFKEAERVLRTASLQQEDLARREEQLSALENEIDQADTALGRSDSVDNAIDVLGLREELERVNVRLSALPPVLEHLSGNEAREVEQREAEIADKRQRRQEAELKLESAANDETKTRLEEPLDPAALDTWRKRVGSLVTLEAQLDNARNELAKRRSDRAQAAKMAGGRDDEALAIDLAGAGALFGFLREATGVATQDEAIAEQLEILKGVTYRKDSQQRLELLREGIGPLRAWLRAPDPGQVGSGSSGGRHAFLKWVAIVLVVAGAAFGLFIHPAFVLLITAGVGIAVTAWFLRRAPESGDMREAAQREFPPDLESPARWVEDAVNALLREFEREAAELEASAKRADYADADRSRLETRRADLEKKKAELERRRGELAAALNLESIPPDAELVDTARALDRLREALQAERSAAESEKTLTEQYQSLLADLSAAFTARGAPEPTDAASARAAVDSLADRDNRLGKARDQQSAARRTLHQADEDIARIEEIVTKCYAKVEVEPGALAGLERILQGLDEYRALRKERDEYRTRVRIAEDRLVKAGESGLTQRTQAQLEADKQHLDAQANRLGALQEQKAGVLVEVKNAREGHDLEDAIAERESRRARLAECRDKALHAAAGRFLLDVVKREHEMNQMPRVLERARELFGRFTHHAYELHVAPGKAGSFVAVEARSGTGYPPDQLSDGTRAQLLLAARLAFAEQVEHAESLPLFLDEALDHSDPTRFRVISRTLGRMAMDGARQIFYLTNDPTDAEGIQNALNEEGCAAANVIDLLAVRRRAASVPDAESLRVEALPEVPEPAGMTPEAYGVVLEIPPFDPRGGAGAQHLFHLLWDDLALLHRLLVSRIENLGQWQNLSRMGAHLAAEIVTGPGAGPELDARALLLVAFCAAWLEGRGSPVERAAIEQSEAISARYLDAVADIAAELDGDAVQLIQVLRERGDERLRGFRKGAADALESYLIDGAYIDPRPVLTESGVTARVQAVPAAEKLPERTVAECIHRWWCLSQRRGRGDVRPDHR